MRFRDQLHRTLHFSEQPRTIVSLVPSQTELLVALGLKDRLVGITKFCVHPKELRKEVAIVGGTKKISFEKIAALQPDVIVCNKEENTKEMVNSLSAIAPVWVSDIHDVPESLEMVALLGELFSVQEKAYKIIAAITSEKKSFTQFMKGRPSKKVAYIIWKDPYMVAGKNTFIDHLLQCNHFENIMLEDQGRYPEIDVALLKQVDLVMLSSEPFPFKKNHVLELQQQLGVEVKLVDGEYFSWYGSRLQKAFEYFKTLH